MQKKKMLDIKMSVGCKNNEQDKIINVYLVFLILVFMYYNLFYFNDLYSYI